MSIAKIIPPQKGEGSLHMTRGTRVELNGFELEGVTKVILTADIDSVWTAEIHCYVQPPEELDVEATIVAVPLPESDERGQIDVTGLSDTTRTWRKV